MAFADLGLPSTLVQALDKAGLTTAFPIQSATIADALAGRDVLGKARTGSGKTLAFGLPAIARLADGPAPQPRKPRAVVLVPTRELAMQVNDALEPYAHAMQVSLRLVAGGLSMSKQVQALGRGVHLVVATPGRLADLVRRGHAHMTDVDLVVLDEADHMAEMGFMDEITEILEDVPRGGQRLLFSATLDGDVDRLVADYMDEPVIHDVTSGDEAHGDMTHLVLSVPPHLKYQVAHRIVAREGRTIVFVRTKLACDRIARQMRDAGIVAVALHGDKTQNERNAAISGFRAGQIPVLVATDVAARGIHVDAVDLVLQMDPPADYKDYTHRAGRTARAGTTGLVVTFSLPHQRKTIDRLIDNAGVDATFRKVRDDGDESMAMVDSLTGAREPSGQAVSLPRVTTPTREGERGGRRGARAHSRRNAPSDGPRRHSGRSEGRRTSEPSPRGAGSESSPARRRERDERLTASERAVARRPRHEDEGGKGRHRQSRSGQGKNAPANAPSRARPDAGTGRKSDVSSPSDRSKGSGPGKKKAPKTSRRSGKPRPKNKSQASPKRKKKR